MMMGTCEGVPTMNIARAFCRGSMETSWGSGERCKLFGIGPIQTWDLLFTLFSMFGTNSAL